MQIQSPNRRDFLHMAATVALVPLMHTGSSMAATPSPRGPWKWTPETGLWETICGDDIVAQLHAAADAGFAAFTDPQLLKRPTTDRDALISAAQIRGIMLGPAYGPSLKGSDTDMWAEAAVPAAQAGLRGLRTEVKATHLTFSLWAKSSRPMFSASGFQRFLELIAKACAIRVPSSPLQPLLFDPIAPTSLTTWWAEKCAEIVHEVNHPHCRLVVDTYRLAAAGIDVVDYMHRHAAIIGHVELADYPGGFEPGSGTLDIAGIVAATALSPHDGMIGLRCGLSQPGPAGLSRLIAAARRHHGLSNDSLA